MASGMESGLKVIGEGSTRSVWSQEVPEHVEKASPTRVIKVERPGPSPGKKTRHEYWTHRQILGTLARENAIQLHAVRRVEIPILHTMLEPGSPDWNTVLGAVSGFFGHLRNTYAILVEKVLPLPQDVRMMLTGRYGDGSHPGYEVTPGTQHCMVRPYLGRYSPPAQPAPGQFSLQNMPLYLSQIDELRLPAFQYAEAMADALAFLYWSVKTDANNVEFVLAPPRPLRQQPGHFPGFGAVYFTGSLGLHCMWLIDFDRCQPLDWDELGMVHAAACFYRNDPYFPRPDGRVWGHFKSRFLQTSGGILAGQSEYIRGLPELLMDHIGYIHSDGGLGLLESRRGPEDDDTGKWFGSSYLK
ncbi:zinc finger protein-domain-containing protein [Lasiosphaeria hispida]|uniref:Zinc finger protein-domain-containing protein n=1 Tax=Lasiosphaeria hispida TaxID=260671 RepID=A0AAJ0HE03_9PEZI|nr:zinc finger protein-domain-containing protein [Lasiosphaeria hispida]